MIAIISALTSLVNGHGSMTVPMSRNIVANTNSEAVYAPAEEEGKPTFDGNPHSLNANTGFCGKTQSGLQGTDPRIDYDKWEDSTGKPMQWKSQKTYTRGQEIDVTIYITAEHSGFFEFKACPKGRDSTQKCFDQYKLELVEDISEQPMPKDPNYPYRAFFTKVEVNKDLKYILKLPEDLVGDEVLLQWVYWTGNTCYMDGFEEYIKEVAKKSEADYTSMDECPHSQEEIPLIRDGRLDISEENDNPELFLNCAEITITDNRRALRSF